MWVGAQDLVKPKTMKLVFIASPVSTQHEGEIARLVY